MFSMEVIVSHVRRTLHDLLKRSIAKGSRDGEHVAITGARLDAARPLGEARKPSGKRGDPVTRSPLRAQRLRSRTFRAHALKSVRFDTHWKSRFRKTPALAMPLGALTREGTRGGGSPRGAAGVEVAPPPHGGSGKVLCWQYFERPFSRAVAVSARAQAARSPAGEGAASRAGRLTRPCR